MCRAYPSNAAVSMRKPLGGIEQSPGWSGSGGASLLRTRCGQRAATLDQDCRNGRLRCSSSQTALGGCAIESGAMRGRRPRQRGLMLHVENAAAAGLTKALAIALEKRRGVLNCEDPQRSGDFATRRASAHSPVLPGPDPNVSTKYGARYLAEILSDGDHDGCMVIFELMACPPLISALR